MKLTRKLSFAIGLGILVVLGVHAALRVQVDRRSYREDVQRDHAILGRSVAAMVELLWTTEGAPRAVEAVEHLNQRTTHVLIRWVHPADAGADAPRRPRFLPRPDAPPRSHVVEDDGRAFMLTYVPVEVPGFPLAAVELYESLEHEKEVQRRSLVRTALTTTTLVVLCIAITIGFGIFFVARPMRLLVAKSERVGDGDLEGPIEIAQDDEVRDLAQAFNAMCDRLRESRERERSAVESRIAMLEQLRHADRLRTIGELASGIAHELGTPLNVVRARGAMIASGEVGEERMQALGTVIVEQVDKIALTIRHLLDYARRSSSQRSDVRLDQITSAVVALLAPMAEKKGVALVDEAPDRAVHATVDGGSVQQAITNVIVNAIQATPAGGTVTVRTANVESGAVIEVSDTGEGIVAEDLPHVREPFFTTKKAGEGTGLGLSIVDGIVTDHRGTLDVTSEPGRGTRVRIVLPPSNGA